MARREIEVPRQAPYTIVRNSIIQDKRLRLQTRAALILMLSCPEDWDYSVRGLAKIAGCNKDTMGKMLAEMEAAGYLERRQEREAGRFAVTYVLRPEPLLPEAEDAPEELPDPEPEEAPPPPDPEPKTGEVQAPHLSEKTGPVESDLSEETGPVKSDEQNTKLQSTYIPPISPQRKVVPNKFGLQEDAKPLLNAYCRGDRELAAAMQDMIANRIELKAINSARAIKAMLEELDRLSYGSSANKVALLRRAVSAGWKTVYPMRDDELPVPPARERGSPSGWAADTEVI